MTSRIGIYALAPLALAALIPLNATAQPVAVTSPKIVITNASGPTETAIPLTGTLQVGADGDISVQCRLVNGACPNIGSGGASGTAPTLQLTSSSTSLETGNPLTLTWSSSGDVCYGVGPSNASGWYQQVFPKSGNKVLSSLAVANYDFSMRCYSAAGSIEKATPTVEVKPQTSLPPAADYCSEYYNPLPGGVQFNAHGFTRVDRTFQQVFGIEPGRTANLRPVPRDQLTVVGDNYLSIGFVMDTASGPNAEMKLDFGLTQGTAGPSGALTVTISPCPGDFRPRNPSAPSDEYVQSYCRAAYGTSGQLTVSAIPGSANFCKAPLNKQMYINIAPRNMYTLPPSVNSCLAVGKPCGLSFSVL